MSKEGNNIRSCYCCTPVTPNLQLQYQENVLLPSIPLAEQPYVSGYSGAVAEPAGMVCDESSQQLKAGISQEVLQEDMELTSGSSGNEMNENDSNGHGSSGNESPGSETLQTSNGSLYDSRKDAEILMESSESLKSSRSASQSLHGSSNAFRLMMTDTEHNYSTSGCSSEQPATVKRQKELMKMLQELKMHLPPEKQTKGKSGMLATLRYALRCIKQVKANEDYYQLLMLNESHPSCMDVSSYTLDEIDNITSEYTIKNADTLAMAISLTTGNVVYISDQAASVLHCKRAIFQNAKFVEFLAPQDIGVFYSSTTPHKLPSWNMCNGVDVATQDCLEEKSFFCRISSSKNHGNGVNYHPFRMTPYLLKVQEAKDSEHQLCCMLFSERVHSGYEAPRIPPDKRIFTTTHTPNCLFHDVDERAVPLLGYLPQDFIGTPALLYIHPDDRHLFIAIHKKVLQFGGQPFEHSPIRFCTQNGEYITVDTSWSSFINPWSRKVSLIMGRHKVRMGPVNEDVFTTVDCMEDKVINTDIQEITEQIYRMLLQPVHNGGSSGYGSLGSNGSLEHLMSGASSSSDSNGMPIEEVQKEKKSTFQEICKDVHVVKNQGQKVFIESRVKLQLKKKQHGAEKQSSLEDRTQDFISPPGTDAGCESAQKKIDVTCKQSSYSYQQINCLDSVIRYLEGCSLPVKRKSELMSNTTPPLAEFKKQSRSDVTTKRCRENNDGGSVVDNRSPLHAPSNTSANLEKDVFKKKGLTKEALAEHTQKEEHSFLRDFKATRRIGFFEKRYNNCLDGQNRRHAGIRFPKVCIPGMEQSWKRVPRNRKNKSKCFRPHESSDSTNSDEQPHRTPLIGANNTAWSHSETSHSSYPHATFPNAMSAHPVSVFTTGNHSQVYDSSVTGISELQDSININSTMQPSPSYAHLVTPVVAVVLPNYAFPQISNKMSPVGFFGVPTFSTHGSFPPPPSVYTASAPFAAQPFIPQEAMFSSHSSLFNSSSERKLQLLSEEQSGRSSAPQINFSQDPASPFYQSRCSSPLQLNLLQLEDALKNAEQSDIVFTSCSTKVPDCCGERVTDNTLISNDKNREDPKNVHFPKKAISRDAPSTSSDLLDIFLQDEALYTGTESASPESKGLGVCASLISDSNGCGVSKSGRGTSETSRTSNYYGSIDSSENINKPKELPSKESKQLIKHVLQDPIWLLMSHADHSVTMSYQIPSRNLDSVLKEDKEKLRAVQKYQPRFTEDQKKELLEVHPWIKKGGLPEAINIKECVYCAEDNKGGMSTPNDKSIIDVDMSDMASQ
ncbi:period circadian protein homolog 2-like [Lissotriton helveticus]